MFCVVLYVGLHTSVLIVRQVYRHWWLKTSHSFCNTATPALRTHTHAITRVLFTRQPTHTVMKHRCRYKNTQKLGHWRSKAYKKGHVPVETAGRGGVRIIRWRSGPAHNGTPSTSSHEEWACSKLASGASMASRAACSSSFTRPSLRFQTRGAVRLAGAGLTCNVTGVSMVYGTL